MSKARSTFVLLFLLGVAPLGAQSFNFGDFSNVGNLSLLGSALQTGNTLRLTTTAAFQTGLAWHNASWPALAGFDTTFTFRITPPASGIRAEGMAFIIQDAPAGSAAMGGGVWALGYGLNGSPGIPNALVVEIDTFQDGFLGDTSGNEVSIHTRGTQGAGEDESFSIGRATPAFLLSDGLPHTMRVRYVPGTLDVFVDNLTAPLISEAYDLVTGGTYLNGQPVGGLGVSAGSVRPGFSATTGASGLWETVEIISWNWMSTPPLDACFAGTVGAGAGGPFDVLTVAGSAGGFFRTVSLNTFQPFTIDLATPPHTGIPAPFVLFLSAGAATGAGGVNLTFGDLCFPLTFPLGPGSLALADGFGIFPALTPAVATPFSLSVPSGAVTVPLTFTLQGVLAESQAPLVLSTTNAVVVEIDTGPPPVITGLQPTSAVPGGMISVLGSGFVQGAGLDIDGLPVVPLSVSATQITFAYPAGVACDAVLTVQNPDGQMDSTTINPTPVVSNALNPMGPAAGGNTWIILGTGFAPGTTVTIGGAPATVTNAGGTAIILITPPGSPGPATTVITTPGGCSTTTTYTYL